MTQIAELSPYENTPGRIRFTRAQCETMRECGILEGRYELIDGEIISKTRQKPPHRKALIFLHQWLISVFGFLSVQTQATIDIGDADPEHNDPDPDAAVTIEPTTFYSDRNPGPADLLLVCEVSDSTVRFDKTKKAALYALAGIQEYWIVDIPQRQLLIFREPSVAGYRQLTVCDADQQAATLARPDSPVRVADLLPPLDAA